METHVQTRLGFLNLLITSPKQLPVEIRSMSIRAGTRVFV